METTKIKQCMGSELKVLRAIHRVTQNELAEKLDTSQTELSAWESGKRFIPWPIVYKLCQIFNISLSTFDFERIEKYATGVKPENDNNLPIAKTGR